MWPVSPERILVILCGVAFLIFLWDVLLQLKIREFDKKIRDMEKKVNHEKTKQDPGAR